MATYTTSAPSSTRVGNKLASMTYYRANQYAQRLDIDENNLMAMHEGINRFSADYQYAQANRI